jgi:hypothetical protein
MANLILVSYIKNIILYVDIKNVICICNKTEMIKVIVSLIQLIETLYIYIYIYISGLNSKLIFYLFPLR